MCSAVPCRRCGKTTWAGCGLHVEEALAGVPAEHRCTCDPVPQGQRRTSLFRRDR